MKFIRTILIVVIILVVGIFSYQYLLRYQHENAVLKQVIARLEADSRVAEVLVTGVNYNEEENKTYTTIKFLEYGADGSALKPRYFTFSGNIIQFQSLVIRFDNMHIRQADRLKGRSAFIFWKVFMLDGENTQEYEITKMHQIPNGYKLKGVDDPFENALWSKFWEYAFDPEQAANDSIKNAQIEAPGTMFTPGYLYVINIEHDGGLRIDSSPLSPILRGERILE